ncbi:MAG: hypothetical protein IPG39_24300 [Bacteroidetes bacterium]|nr:hypothetical protein [Bacteroidota bacterium]
MAQKLSPEKSGKIIMKKLLFISIFLRNPNLSGSNASAVFLVRTWKLFQVIMNGLRKNDKPETNVKVTGLDEHHILSGFVFADKHLSYQ